MPIATIFTPATLSIESASTSLSNLLQVPQFDFTSLNFVFSPQYFGAIDYSWNGPSQPVQHIALAVMGQGDILQISSPGVNTSWSLNFWGPALHCNDVVGVKRDSIFTNMWNSLYGGDASYSYLSWVPWSDASFQSIWSRPGVDPDLPFLLNSQSPAVHNGPPGGPLTTNGPASIYVAAMPNSKYLEPGGYWNHSKDIWSFWWKGDAAMCDFKLLQNLDESFANANCYQNASFNANWVYKDATLLRCDLLNTSYVANFSYPNGNQHVDIKAGSESISKVLNGSQYFAGPLSPHPEGFKLHHIVERFRLRILYRQIFRYARSIPELYNYFLTKASWLHSTSWFRG